MKPGNQTSNFFNPADIEPPRRPERSNSNAVTADDAEPEKRAKRQKKEENTPKRHNDKPNSFLNFVRDRRTRIFTGILLVGISTYLFISSVSYFTTGRDDQSMAMNMTVGQMTSAGNEIGNSGGALGAAFSHNFISNGFGLGTLVLIAYFFILGWRLLHKRPFNFLGLTLRSILLAITISIVTGLVTFNLKSWVYWGGIHGYEVNAYLMRLVGLSGTLIVSACLVGMIIAIYFNELRLIYLRYRRKANAIALKRRLAAEEKAARRAMADEGLQKSDATLVNDQPAETTQPTSTDSDPLKPLNFGEDFLGATTSTEPAHAAVTDMPPTMAEKNESTSSATEAETGTAAGPDLAGLEIVDNTKDTTGVTDIDNTLGSVLPDDNHTEETEGNEHHDTQAAINPEFTDPDLTVIVNEVEEADTTDNELFDPTATLSRYVAPSLDLLSDSQLKGTTVDQEEMEKNKLRITETLGKYDIPIVRIDATVGPTVTLYEIVPDDGVRIARVKRLEDDIAMSLAAKGIRIIAPIPGRGSIGIEVPNEERQLVSARTVFGSRKFQECNNMELPLAMGATISRDIYITDLAKMPHLLVAGATGTGKSVGLNVIIASLMFKKHPSELKFVLIDPKMVEFSLYAKLERHYLAKLPDEEEAVITEPQKAAATLNSLCAEMDNRYKLLKDAAARNIKEYNEKFIHRRLSPEKGHFFMPYIVVVVDEFGDLFMLAGKDVEVPIARIAQKARAVGIHMILATQRPSADIIKGFIRANFPARMAFQVASRIDSMTILDRPGAQGLIGKGDMLCSNLGEMDRVQCAFISTEEIEAIVAAVDAQIGYQEAYLLPEFNPAGDTPSDSTMNNVSSRDPLFAEAARFIVATGTTASTSMLQRRYSIGYNRAGKIMDQMEQAGIVGPASGSKPRAVLMDPLQLERFLEIPLAQ